MRRWWKRPPVSSLTPGLLHEPAHDSTKHARIFSIRDAIWLHPVLGTSVWFGGIRAQAEYGGFHGAVRRLRQCLAAGIPGATACAECGDFSLPQALQRRQYKKSAFASLLADVLDELEVLCP